ncbi:hypothetical protein ACTFIW_006443 [Dictyostelium discoideum]
MFQTGGLFGQASTTTGGGLFGTAVTPTSTGGSGLFGTSTAVAPTSTGGGLFGTSTAVTPTSTGGGLFGTSTAVAPTSTGGGLFGGGGVGLASSIGPQGGGGLFGSTTLPTSTSGSGLFGGQSSIGFGQPNSGGLFGSTSMQQPQQQQQQPQQPQQPLITESTKFSDLPPQLKNELQILNKMIINNNSLMNSFSNYDTKINEISIGLDQVASVMDNLFNNFDIHIQSFKYLEESLAKPLNSVNEQVHLLSTQFHSPFSQARPSKEMEIIVDSLVEKIDRIKQTILCVAPTNKSQSQNLSFQESFISTLQSNQIILRNLAYIVDNLVTELERHKKHFLLYKKKYYNQNYNPFLKQPKLNEKTDYHGSSSSSLHHSHFSQSSNLLSSQSSLFGSSMYGRQSQQQQQNPQQSQYLQSSTFQPIQTSTSFFNPTSTTTTSFGLTNNNNNNSLASNNSSSGGSSSGSSLGSLGSLGSGSGSGLFGSTATNNSLGSTSSSGSTGGSIGSNSIVIPPLAIGSITNNNSGGGLFGSSNSSSNSLNSLSTSSSNLFGPPQTPTLSGQGSTLGSGGFSISASASNLDTPNRKKNSLNSSKR